MFQTRLPPKDRRGIAAAYQEMLESMAARTMVVRENCMFVALLLVFVLLNSFELKLLLASLINVVIVAVVAML